MLDRPAGDSWRTLRDQVFEHVTRGDRAGARQMLRDAARRHPGEEQVWIWLAKYAADDQERRAALERALAINPFNQQAKKDLAELGGSPPAPPAPAPGVYGASPGPPPVPPVGGAGYGPGFPQQHPAARPGGAGYAPGQPTQPLTGSTGYAPGQPTQPLMGGTPTSYGAPASWQEGSAPGYVRPAASWGGAPQSYGAMPGAPQGYLSPPNMFAMPGLERGRRPGCVGAIAVLFMVGAILAALGGLIALLSPETFGGTFAEVISELGGIALLLGALVVVLAGLGFATSVGLWRGQRYGWWMAGVYCAMSIMEGVLSLPGGGSGTFTSMLRLAIYGSFMAVLFQDDALLFFGMSDFGKSKALMICFGAGVALGIGLIMVGVFLGLLLGVQG